MSGPWGCKGAEHVSQAGVCLRGVKAGGAGCGAAGLAHSMCHRDAEQLCPTWALCPEFYLHVRKGGLNPESRGLWTAQAEIFHV